MSDANIIDRFTDYICNGLFKFSDPWIRSRYFKFRKETKPFEAENFFVRMQKDMSKRKKATRKREKKQENASKDLAQTYVKSMTFNRKGTIIDSKTNEPLKWTKR